MVVWWRGCQWWARGRTDVIVIDVNRQLLSVFCHLSVLSVPSWLSRACGNVRFALKTIRPQICAPPSTTRPLLLTAWNTQSFIQVRFLRKTTPRRRNEKHWSRQLAVKTHLCFGPPCRSPMSPSGSRYHRAKGPFSAEGIWAAVFSWEVDLLLLWVNSSPKRAWYRWEEGFILGAQWRLEKADENPDSL